jgi:hypothetical protein
MFKLEDIHEDIRAIRELLDDEEDDGEDDDPGS